MTSNNNYECWVVQWYDPAFNLFGQSTCWPKRVVDDMVREMNAKYPDIYHWPAQITKPSIKQEPPPPDD